jgi:uncharacterized protein (TIGR03435 family)
MAAPPERLAFEVVSIRLNQSPQGSPPSRGPTPDGYHMSDASLLIPMLTAYVPQSGAAFFSEGQVRGLPDWFISEKYDVDAKVGDGDLAEWQKPASQAAMLPQMLQTMFADRCKMVVHREMQDVSVYLLKVGKGGPKFKETNPSEDPPKGTNLPGEEFWSTPVMACTYMECPCNLSHRCCPQSGEMPPVARSKTGRT